MPLQLFIELQIVGNAIDETIDQLLTHTEKAIDDFTNAFPNPADMLDVVLNYFTSLPGFLVSAPFAGVERMMVGVLRDHKIQNRVLTLEAATRMAFEAHKEFARQLTFTDNSGLIGLLAGWFARFIWTFAKKVSLIRKLLGVSTLDQLVKVLVDSFKRRIRLLKIIGAVIGIAYLVLSAGFLLWAVGLLLLWLEGDLNTRLLPQDSKRKRMSFRNREVRVNARTGRDFPDS